MQNSVGRETLIPRSSFQMAVVGGSSAFQGYLMESALGLKINWVPYLDSGKAMATVAGKHADTLLTFTISPIPLIRAGKLRPLAVFSLTPDPILLDVPNFKEVGHPEVPLVRVYGVFMAPPNTPRRSSPSWKTRSRTQRQIRSLGKWLTKNKEDQNELQ